MFEAFITDKDMSEFVRFVTFELVKPKKVLKKSEIQSLTLCLLSNLLCGLVKIINFLQIT